MKRPSKYTYGKLRESHIPFTTMGEDFESDVIAHWNRIPEGDQTDDNMKFHRWYFRDEREANRFVAALKSAGGFGVVIGNSARVCGYWHSIVSGLLPDFEIGAM